MPPSPIPAPLPVWAKALLQIAPLVSGYLYDVLTYANEAPSVMQWRKLMVKAHITAGTPAAADDAWCSWDLINITGGNVDNSWTTADYAACEARFDTFWTAYKPNFASWATISEYRWYVREFTPIGPGNPFKDSGPPARVTAKAIAGTATSGAIPQASTTITEKTPWPHHWGRTYLPFFANQNIANGRLTTAVVDTLATAAQTLYAGLATDEFFPVVPVTSIKKDPARALVAVTNVQVDDVPDVVRRRRPRNVLYRKVLP